MTERPQPKKFNLKDGYCQIFPDRLTIVQDKNLQIQSDHHLIRILLRSVLFGGVFIAVGAVAFIFAISIYRTSSFFNLQFIALVLVAIACVTMAFIIMVAIASTLINATAGVIERDQITKVKFKSGIPLIINPYFLVKYKVLRKTKKRLLILPTTNTKNDPDIANAVIMMRQEDLI